VLVGLLLDDGWTLQEPHPPFMTKCLRLVIYVRKHWLDFVADVVWTM
jgi:hypothetical protein